VERDHPALVEHGGRLYFLGGQDGGPRADAFVYDPAGDEWQAIAPMPAARAQHAAVAIGERIYVFGGVTPAGPGGAALETWAYEPDTDSWITGLAAIPTQRNHLAGVVLGGRAWAIGGRWDLNETTVESYDPATDTWRPEAPLLVATSGATAALLDGRIHVTGGEDFVRFATIAAHQVYDPTSNEWSPAAELPLPRHGLGSAVIGGEWIVVGGGPVADYSASARVDVFTP
jgi:N-acetylneuraminic acid mutarotase